MSRPEVQENEWKSQRVVERSRVLFLPGEVSEAAGRLHLGLGVDVQQQRDQQRRQPLVVQHGVQLYVAQSAKVSTASSCKSARLA